MGLTRNSSRNSRICCCILSFTGKTLLLDRKFLLATRIVYHWQEIYILWNEMCTYTNRNPSCDNKFLHEARYVFLLQEMPSYILIFLSVTSNFVLLQENSSCHNQFVPVTDNFFLWHEIIFVSPNYTKMVIKLKYFFLKQYISFCEILDEWADLPFDKEVWTFQGMDQC